MALSQIQCLDDNNVNQRIHESKPEFFYCEEQRLALEALLQDGREAFVEYLESRGLRGFLSDLELGRLADALEPFDPDSELFLGQAEDDPEPLSLQYWPEVSDTSIPQMDLGWPDSESYRGVTRTSVYTQPPMEGQAHIKEVVRKMIAQAQKVIAVVMDVFTDIDIFRDLLDAGFKRKVSVYILLERAMLPHFLSMCRRANMHAGHLKHLRVRYTEGAEFYTRYCTKVRGQLGHRFMFIDGDKAVSGSYSFTWMSSRLDRNLITVITGQTVDAFDQLFRYLYMTSSFVDLRKLATDPEPEPDTRHQVLPVAPPSAAISRKLYNPKYALVALRSPSPVNSNGNDSPKEPEISEDPKNKKKRKRTHENLPQDAPPLHPGLIDLEKACLLSYLPTWPEPDPPSDVIGFINIRDSTKPTQVHLQRSEMFETSQAIKFSSPFSKPQETLPSVAKPRNRIAQSESKTKDLLVDKAKPEQKSVGLVDNNNKEMAHEQKSLLYRQELNTYKNETKVLPMDNKLCSNTATDADSGSLCLTPNALPESSFKALTSKNELPSLKAQVVSKTISKPLNESKNVKEPEVLTVLKTQRTLMDPTNILKSNTAQKAQLHEQTQLKIEETEKKNIVSHQDSHTNTADTQPKISSEKTLNLQVAQSDSAAKALLVDVAKPEQKSVGVLDNNNKEIGPEEKSLFYKQKLNTDKSETKSLRMENKLCSNMATDADSSRLCLTPNAPPQSSIKAVTPKNELPSLKAPLHIKDTEEKNIASHYDSQSKTANRQPKISFEKTLNLRIAQGESKTEDLLIDKARSEQKSVGPVENSNKEMAPEQKSVLHRQKLNQDRSETKVLRMENKVCLNMATCPDSGPPSLSPNALPQSSIKALTPKNEQPSSESTFIEPTNTAQKSQLHKQTQLNTEDLEEKNIALHQDSHTNTTDTQLKISSEKTRYLRNPGTPGHIAASSASPVQSESYLSKNNLVTSTAVPPATYASSCNSLPSTCSPSTLPPSTSSFPPLPLLPSSASSCTTSIAPDSKLCSDQVFKQDGINSNNKTTADISVVKRSNTSLRPQIVNDVSPLAGLVQKSHVKNLKSTPELQRNSVGKTEDQKHTENTNVPKNIKQETRIVVSQKTTEEGADGTPNGRAEVQPITETQLETQSDVSMKDSTKKAIVDVNEIVPKSVDLKTHRDCITTTADTRTSHKTQTNLEFDKVTNTTQTYLARCHEPQIISYSNFTLQDINMVKPLNSLTAPINCTSDNLYTTEEKHGDSIKSAANTLSQRGKQAQVPSVDCTDITLNSIKQHTHNTFQEQACKTQGGAYTSRETLNLHLSNVQVTDLSLQTNKQESQLPVAVVETSTLKVFAQNLPTPDSRTTSPDPRTPTTDVSDGYFSPREDSTTSEEYFECNESPSPVLDASWCRNHGMIENNSPTHSDSSFSRNIGTSPADLDNIPSASALASASQSTYSSEGSTISWTSGDPPASLLGTKEHSRGIKLTNKRNSKEKANIEKKSSNTEKKVDKVHQSMEGTDNKELNRMPGPLKKDSDLKEMALKLSKASGRQIVGGMTEGESVKETKRLSTGELKPERLLSEGKKAPSGKDKPLNQAALTPSNMEIKQRQPTRETTGQKPLHPSPKSQPRQQPGNGGSSPSRPVRSSRTIRDLNQTESRVLQSNFKVSGSKPPPRRSQSRSPSPLKAAPVGSVSGRKQVSQSQPRLLAQQPPAAQIPSKPDQLQIQTPKQQPLTLHTLPNLQPQVHLCASTEKVSEQAAPELEEARVPFYLPFGRLYNFKGLRDKFTKQPTQSRSSTSTPVKERKSTS